jgi:hypothetical protein
MNHNTSGKTLLVYVESIPFNPAHSILKDTHLLGSLGIGKIFKILSLNADSIKFTFYPFR